jgi:hypothetical protein
MMPHYSTQSHHCDHMDNFGSLSPWKLRPGQYPALNRRASQPQDINQPQTGIAHTDALLDGRGPLKKFIFKTCNSILRPCMRNNETSCQRGRERPVPSLTTIVGCLVNDKANWMMY